jgi:hypothetical protein
VRARIADVQRMPAIATLLVVDGEHLRRVIVRRFPYSILFAELADEQLVLTVSHRRRSDEHWRARATRP